MGAFDRERNLLAPEKREFAGHTKEKTNTLGRDRNKNYKTDDTKTTEVYNDFCPHCGCYGHLETNCKGKRMGRPKATDEEREKRKMHCKTCKKAGRHKTEDCPNKSSAYAARSATQPPSILKKTTRIDDTDREFGMSAGHHENQLKGTGFFGSLTGLLYSAFKTTSEKIRQLGSIITSGIYTAIIKEYAFLTVEERAAYACPAYRSSKDLPNWLFDSGATAHMTPHLEDLENVNSCDVIITLADGSEVRCHHAGECAIDIIDDNGTSRKLRMGRVLYVPGLDRRLLSVPYFCQTSGNSMHFTSDDIEMTFCGYITKTFPARTLHKDYANAAITRAGQDRLDASPSSQHLRPVDSDLLHLRLGHRGTNAILTASKHRLWRDAIAVAGADPFCTSCRIAVQPKAPRSSTPMTIPS
ncbi:MAG: hypothetical protein ACREOZ_00200, partial [Gloeomargaritales cyanobacterium]